MADSIIGLISDTHGLLRPQACELLRSSDHIIHAGDVGEQGLLQTLQTIAPVTVVRGNVDRDPWTQILPLTAAAMLFGLNFYVLHDIADLDLNPAVANIDFVVFGHSHKPTLELRSGVHYLNPGSAGPRRFRLPVTVARIQVTASKPTIELLDVLSGQVLPLP